MILDDASLRCWGLDDPRAIHDLAYENDPGTSRHGRAGVVEERARAAGWPELHVGISRNENRRAVTAVAVELTGINLAWELTQGIAEHADIRFRYDE
jgi:hypothetical protein